MNPRQIETALMATPLQIARVLVEIAAERARQDVAHPNDNCSQPTIHNSFKLTVLVEEVGEVAQALQRGCLDTTGRAHLREELIQVAAVAAAWAESLTEETNR